jgi:hypothetical protein
MLLAILFCHSLAFASITENGRGMLFGADHAFFVTAASGWVLDNQSGVRQGLHMVFYPVGRTWSDSPVIIYGRAVPKSEVPTIKSHIERTVEEFHKNGSPNYTGERQPSIKLPNSKKVDLYHFSGDQWGNYEAAAYYDEKDTINYLIFNARTKESFNKYLKNFREISLTYKNIYTSPSTSNKMEVDKLILESKKHLKFPGGQEYETKAIQAVGHQMANFMRDCTSYLSNDELPPFHLFIRINGDGTTSGLEVYPTNALSVCFKGLMSNIKYPSHAFDSFLIDIEMKVTE